MVAVVVVWLCRRVDAAVRCSTAGDFDVRIESTLTLGQTVPLAVLTVEAGSGSADDDLDTWTPCR